MTSNHQKGGALAKLAAIFCEQSLFRAFLNEKLPDPHLHIGTAEEATEHLKMVCNVKSRERRFHDLVRIPYVHWQLRKDSE
ncbi:hypothetical protein [Herbaspirillum autotrophicum]|uniref:hypothetical protein n=1 Tax=Herbaspirillum autotrophicum TaxID=180195 RepID=UPI00067D698C|nr:hypothetical protein [Herbaspirillum autotrophicum]